MISRICGIDFRVEYGVHANYSPRDTASMIDHTTGKADDRPAKADDRHVPCCYRRCVAQKEIFLIVL